MRSTTCSRMAVSRLIVLIGGVDGAGKGETVNLLNEWMDPRHIRTARIRTSRRTRNASARRCGATGGHCRRRERSASSSATGTPIPSSTGSYGDIRAARTRPAGRAHRALRADAGRRRRAAAQVLVPPLEAGTEEAAEGAGEGSEHALAGYRHRLGTLPALRQVSQGRRARAARNQQRPCAVDRDRRRGRRLSQPDRRQARCWRQCAERLDQKPPCKRADRAPPPVPAIDDAT